MHERKPKLCEDCSKFIFPNEDQAREHLGHLLRKHRRFTKRGAYAVKPYQCPVGTGWHVGRDHKTLMINFKKGRIFNVDKKPVQSVEGVSLRRCSKGA